MVTPNSKQARGYAVQICILLKNAPDLELGESKEFPPPKILTAKTVGTYMAKNKNIVFDEDEPALEKPAEKNKAGSKKRPATTVEAPVAKKKKTNVEKAAPQTRPLVTVAQDVEPIIIVPAVTPRASRRRAPKRKLVLQIGSDDEIVDSIIHQVIADTATIETEEPDVEEPEIMRSAETDIEGYECSTAVNDEDDNLDGAENEIARKITSFTAPKQFLNEPLRSGKDDDISGSKQQSKIIEPTAAEKDKEIESVATEDFTMELNEKPSTSDEELMSLEDLLKQIPDDMMVPSVTTAEPTKIKFGQGIEIRLAVLDSVKDIATQEELVLTWAEIDSVHIAVQRRVYIIAKYREMLLRKFLEARRHNFVPGTPTTAINLKVLDLLTAAHHFAPKILLRQMKEHKLEWTRPYSSHLFEGINVQPGVDNWRPISRTDDSNKWEMLPQRPYIDDLAPLCAFVEPVQDLDSRSPFSRRVHNHWTEFCVAIVQFLLLGFLRPVGVRIEKFNY
ncbi:splicing factor 3B subunit 1-like [Dorcoceras hygrometricum]|uniref:Splicing factor 3B subunit 1-like n=1 Tax=Dorcoceras hygrometricum TaxID=472368 RepID=A0A2Z7D0N0_9LAMI|nr:splicing factor 3B subunit 1-like [Dorcoceras hygrometricum]